MENQSDKEIKKTVYNWIFLLAGLFCFIAGPLSGEWWLWIGTIMALSGAWLLKNATSAESFEIVIQYWNQMMMRLANLPGTLHEYDLEEEGWMFLPELDELLYELKAFETWLKQRGSQPALDSVTSEKMDVRIPVTRSEFHRLHQYLIAWHDEADQSDHYDSKRFARIQGALIACWRIHDWIDAKDDNWTGTPRPSKGSWENIGPNENYL
jgi:hypothetical protein